MQASWIVGALKKWLWIKRLEIKRLEIQRPEIERPGIKPLAIKPSAERRDPMMWRQGDVLIRRVEAIPDLVQRSPRPLGVLARGELTGHSHRLQNPDSARIFSGATAIGELYLEVPAGGTRIIHEEHGPIELPEGLYRAWRQREYTPRAIRIVGD